MSGMQQPGVNTPAATTNWANVLTLSRLLAAIPVVVLLFTQGWEYKLAALGIFLLASLTDWFDGRLARRHNRVTALGNFLDPLADKVLVIAIFVTFIRLDPEIAPQWLVILLVMREFLLTYIRLVAIEDLDVLKTESMGKTKTAVQLITLTSLLAFAILKDYHVPVSDELPASTITDWLRGVGGEYGDLLAVVPLGLVMLSVGLTVYSGIRYVVINRNMFR